ncbi:MAG TPA: efflux RND transporter periplasmic adaptor subunit [Candidatus Angelobacter sp.]|nr:efflux RND transporter periplasmic adaptor subunit [Candidatus Angelobacter sp.]
MRIFFCCTLALLISGCGRQTTDAAGPAEPPRFPVKVVTAQAQMVPEVTDYLATLKSRNASALQPQVEGEVTRIFVRSGEKVDAGAAILEIDPKKQQATVNNQEATYKSKLATMEFDRVDLERKRKLYAAGVIAKADLDTAQAAYDAAKADAEALAAGIREQSEQLRYYTVRAPTTGIIGDIPVHVGDRVATTTVLTTLDRGGELEAYIYVPAEKSGAVRANMPLEIMSDEGKTLLRTTVFFISPEVDTGSQTLLLKAKVLNTVLKFRNDQSVHARLIWSEQKLPMIPVTAVSRLSGKMFAFVVEGEGQKQVARQRVIQVGDLIGNDYVVLDGIHSGDRVITSGVQMLTDGMLIVPQT